MRTGQEQITSDVLARRRRRAQTWLVITVALHLLMLAVTVALLRWGNFEVDSLVIVVTFAVAPVAGALWLERRHPSAGKPDNWPWRSLAVAFPQAIALGYAVSGVLDEDVPAPWQRILLVLAVTLVPAVAAALARRALLRPWVPELGEGDFEVLGEPRTGRRPWYYSDSIALTDREIVIAVRSGSGRATWNPKVERIALADVTAVGARPALAQDSPWITLSDGRGLSVQPGDVVVVQCGEVRQVLPISDAAAFAGMLRIRVARVRGTPVAAPAAETPTTAELVTEAGTGQPRTGHVPEVLPAPEPSGSVAHPVAGPLAALRAGPGMAVRWALGFPLALLGIVGVPLGLLVAGSLLPAAPGLERYRLGCCVLWIALASAIWLWSWQQPRYWPAWALMSALATAIIVAFELGLVAMLGPLLAVPLTWAGRRMLIKPVGTDLAASRLELPVRGGNVTLLVQRDRIVLKLRAGAGGAVPQALPLGELTVAQPGQFAGTEVRWWPVPGGRQMRLGSGPVLRLVSGRQQWLLSVGAPRELAAIIRARAATASRHDPHPSAVSPLTLSQWYELQSWAARQLTTTGTYLKQRAVGFRLVVAIPAAFIGSALLTESIARGAGLGTGFPVVAAVALVIAAVFMADWVRVRRRLRVAENNALPPGSPGWGELHPDHVPLTGWQPWWDGPRP